jgi:membrane protease YdiL (CAAX protease family)
VVPGLFILGIVLAFAALRTGDLSLPIALHSGINLLAAVSLLWGDDILEWSEQKLEELEALVTFLPF